MTEYQTQQLAILAGFLFLLPFLNVELVFLNKALYLARRACLRHRQPLCFLAFLLKCTFRWDPSTAVFCSEKPTVNLYK